MTAFLVLLAAIVVLELVSVVRAWRGDRPTIPPPSHPEWTTGRLPSHPYAD